MRHRVNNLDDRFQEVKQKFYYILFGREQAPSRWKNCVTQVNSNMGMAVGSMFVGKYFDENSKNDVSIFSRGRCNIEIRCLLCRKKTEKNIIYILIFLLLDT